MGKYWGKKNICERLNIRYGEGFRISSIEVGFCIERLIPADCGRNPSFSWTLHFSLKWNCSYPTRATLRRYAYFRDTMLGSLIFCRYAPNPIWHFADKTRLPWRMQAGRAFLPDLGACSHRGGSSERMIGLFRYTRNPWLNLPSSAAQAAAAVSVSSASHRSIENKPRTKPRQDEKWVALNEWRNLLLLRVSSLLFYDSLPLFLETSRI